MHSRPQWPSIGGEDVPVSPPPGLEARAPRAVPYGKEKALHVARRNGHSDIYTVSNCVHNYLALHILLSVIEATPFPVVLRICSL